MGTFGWDLPPGCRLSDIPGNRPEDEAWEVMIDNFLKGLSEEELQLITQTAQEELIIKAIEYGIGVQIEEQKRIEEENKYYKEWAEDCEKDKGEGYGQEER